MYAKKIKYYDYNDVERTETFYFNLTKAELIKLQMSTEGGLEAFINKITSQMDGKELAKLFEDLILMSYGEKSLDGKRFVKSKELAEAFSQTEAYSQFYMDLLTNADAAQAFVNGIMPKDIQEQAKKMKAEGKLPDSITGEAITTPIE